MVDGGSPHPRPAPLDAELGFRMGRTHRALRDGWERQLLELGLSAPQAATLRTVVEEPGSGVRELARRTGTDPMNAKRLVDHLERAGLVRSGPDPSHRQRRGVEPTPSGEAMALRIAQLSAAWRHRLSRRLGRDDLDHLLALLSRLETVLADDAGHAERHRAPTTNDDPTGRARR
ncbi:MarR family winged helix-turn-helix transcriptional regulator [Isoptericola sp. b441]|uniref:MarR family winged helix-turn-helix transcriptional regulator n=1 Tax=Actinotalea lenta TaxID=3064654 RepID=A0ABT9DEA0_9CELL|nr:MULTISPECIES: MarR family winged helix-turn-helix transcriptional regulator [unclassified Isoptericola]MDO8107713.1 MarR family winged helix-turn-helix transcriptional regulator [Isoptericola sp. b441]MDO8120616.1 MarR family winged helix-turn-helix transcriptional regulator [Isoptericola sp. b490]